MEQNKYKFISSKSIISKFKSSRLFKTDLGKCFINDGKNGLKMDLSRQEEFVKVYFQQNESRMIFKEGNIGSIEFYSDPKIHNNVIIYLGQEYFVFQHDPNALSVKGIEKYLGSIIKEIETKNLLGNITNTETKRELTQEELYIQAQNKIKTNPGMVTYDDVKHLLKNKRRNK